MTGVGVSVERSAVPLIAVQYGDDLLEVGSDIGNRLKRRGGGRQVESVEQANDKSRQAL